MAVERTERRLAAILAADVVGYSRLMGLDEVGTLDRLKALRREVFTPTITEFGGRIFKITGDGALAEFASAVDAVHSAVAVQRALAERNATLPEDKRLELRIGASLGDVIVEGGDLYGNGVNVAARMEGLADPGGICISGNVYEHVSQSLEMNFEDLGDQSVKNIDRPIRCYRVEMERSGPSEDGAQRSRSAAQLSDKPSIAVLPFDNLSDDPQQEYFSDGLAEDLITDLSKISNLSVAARNSSFSFKGQMPDVKDVAEKLGVTFILEGSVRKMGDRLRINAQLIDGADGRHIWAERYDGDMENIFEFQDDIREQIVSALQVSLTPTDKALAERKPTDSVEAYDLFLKGRENFYRYTPEHFLEAIKCLEEAIEIDPNFADAYSYLAWCHHLYGWTQFGPEYDDTLDRAHELAERGVALDGTSAFALALLGWIQAFLNRHDQAIANLEKAIAMAPNDAGVYATFGQVLNYWGNPERALEMIEKAFSLETFAPPTWEFQLGHSHLLLRQYDEALTRYNGVIERAPKFALIYLHLACAYVELDRLDDARDAIKTALEIVPKYTVKELARILPYRIDEVRDRFVEGLRKAGLPEG
jgi:adenylate cyclase